MFAIGAFNSWGAVAEEKPFIMSTSVGAPLYFEDGSGFFNLLVAEIFRRLNTSYELIHLPAQRAIVFANNSTVDGTGPRAAAIEDKPHSLIRIQEKIFDFEYMAYTRDPTIKIEDWSSLKPYTVGIINGWKIVEHNVEDAKSVIKVNNFGQLLRLLEKGRVDVAILDRVMGGWKSRQLGLGLMAIEPPLIKKPNFIYVHKKHKNLVRDISRVVVEIKEDGTYEAIYTKALSDQQAH